MGTVIEDLDDHEGYADRRLPDGRLAGGVWTYTTREFTAYVAVCGCGWQATGEHPPTEEGEEAAVDQWRWEHAEPLLVGQAQQRRAELTRLLRALGDNADHLGSPAQLARISRATDRVRELTAAIRRDLKRRLGEREVDDAR